MKCDLHTHSIFSDGTCTPEEIIKLAEIAGVDVVALTDHNTFDGLPRFMKAAENSPVMGVPGIEISTDWTHPVSGKDYEVHIVGLWVPVNGTEELRNLLDLYRQRKAESNIRMAEKLREAGIPIDLEKMKEDTPAENINRAFFGEAIVKLGFAKSIPEAFDLYLKPGGGFYEPPRRLSIQEAVNGIRNAGGHAVLGHPMQTFDSEEDVRLILDSTEGFEGIEVNYPSYTREVSQAMKALAAEKGLIESGGSDFHGTRKKGIFVGSAFIITT